MLSGTFLNRERTGLRQFLLLYSVNLFIVNFQKCLYIASFEFHPQNGKCLLWTEIPLTIICCHSTFPNSSASISHYPFCMPDISKYPLFCELVLPFSAIIILFLAQWGAHWKHKSLAECLRPFLGISFCLNLTSHQRLDSNAFVSLQLTPY